MINYDYVEYDLIITTSYIQSVEFSMIYSSYVRTVNSSIVTIHTVKSNLLY